MIEITVVGITDGEAFAEKLYGRCKDSTLYMKEGKAIIEFDRDHSLFDKTVEDVKACMPPVAHIMKEPITVWSFYDAPKELRDLSTNGGDEDWLAEIPEHLTDAWIPWLDDCKFGNMVDEYDHKYYKLG